MNRISWADKFIQKKVLEDMGIPVPEEALGFYTKDHILFFEVLNTGTVSANC